VMIAQAHTKFADGKLTDETTGQMLGALGSGWYCRSARSGPRQA